jgi:hypothetical protein
LRHWPISRRVAGSIPDGVIDIILPAANECQEYLLGVKVGGV